MSEHERKIVHQETESPLHKCLPLVRSFVDEAPPYTQISQLVNKKILETFAVSFRYIEEHK